MSEKAKSIAQVIGVILFFGVAFASCVTGMNPLELANTIIHAPSEEEALTEDAVYLAALRQWSAEQDYLTIVDAASDAELLQLGHNICLEMARGASAEDIMDSIEAEYGAPAAFELSSVVGMAVGAFCPHLA